MANFTIEMDGAMERGVLTSRVDGDGDRNGGGGSGGGGMPIKYASENWI